MSDIIAGIVLFNPDIERLSENIGAIIEQVSLVLLVDNNSSNIDDIVEKFSTHEKINIIKNDKNRGIAFALNQIIDFAEAYGAKWALTLDQDSVAPQDLIEKYSKHLEDNKVAMITCNVLDRNTNRTLLSNDSPRDFENVKYCITSASLNNVTVIKSLGGYDNSLFIDSVDHDICERIIRANYRILRVNSVTLIQEIGHSKLVKLFGKTYTLFNHSPFRNFYIGRNAVIIYKRYRTPICSPKMIMRDLLLVALYENQKISKIYNRIRGIISGIFYKI